MPVAETRQMRRLLKPGQMALTGGEIAVAPAQVASMLKRSIRSRTS
jgi:hypothetical protein